MTKRNAKYGYTRLQIIYGIPSGPTLVLGFNCFRVDKTISGVKSIEQNFIWSLLVRKDIF